MHVFIGQQYFDQGSTLIFHKYILMPWLFVGPTGVYLLDYFCSGIQFILLLSPYLCFISLLYLDLTCFRRWCIDKLGVFHANQISMYLDPHLNYG